MPTQCSICLCEYIDPVSIPCGHIYCTKCLSDHVNAPTNQGFTSSCPTCRAPFNTLNPDLTYLPRKYHQYVLPSVRRVYPAIVALDDHAHLKEQIQELESRIVICKRREEQLLKQCERYLAAAQAHREGERDAKAEALDAQNELDSTRDELEAMKEEMEELRSRAEDAEVDKEEAEVARDEAEEEREEAEEARDEAERRYESLEDMFERMELAHAEEVNNLKDEIIKLKKKNMALKQQVQLKERERLAAISVSVPIAAPVPTAVPVQLLTPERPSPGERKVRPLPKRTSRALSPTPEPLPAELRVKKARLSMEMESSLAPTCSCGEKHPPMWYQQ